MEYDKAYKRYYARTKYNGNKHITQNEFLLWANKAKDMKNKAKSGEITFEKFK